MMERNYVIVIYENGDIIKSTVDVSTWFNDCKRLYFRSGYCECVYPFGHMFPCLIDEDGKHRGYDINPVATRLCSGILMRGDWIAGPLVVTHYNGRDDMEPLTLDEANEYERHIVVLSALNPMPSPLERALE